MANAAPGEPVPDGRGNLLYLVDRIVAHQVDRITCSCRFRVKWAGHTGRNNTWEPLENLLDCLDLIEDYMGRTERAFARAYARQGYAGPAPSRIEQVKPAVIKRFQKKIGNGVSFYVPTGNETVTKIRQSYVHNTSEFYFVGFLERPKVLIRKVPRILMEYYFPSDVILYEKEQLRVLEEELAEAEVEGEEFEEGDTVDLNEI